MAGGGKSGARWVVPLLVGALIASAGVGYALVRITGPDDEGDEVVLTTDSTSTTPIVPPSTTSPTTAPPSTSSSTPIVTSSTTESEPTVPSATSTELPGSDVLLPAAWSGTATVTVSVIGECATGTPSVYTDIPADIALDLVGNEANATETPLGPDVDPDLISLTLGINPSAIPSLAVYSSQLDEEGAWHRFWDLEIAPGANWTEIHGRLTQQPNGGSNPNMMVDSETSLQPCEGAGSVSLPRALAAGSTLDGWVTRTRAKLTLDAVTTDGKRQVEVEIDALRRQ